MVQDSLILIKPDGVKRRMIGQIIASIESLGASIKCLNLIKLTQKQAELLYKEHKGKWHFSRNIKHITSGPVVVIHVSGRNIVSKCREMVETYRLANQDVIKLPKNLLHATSEPSSAKDELQSVGCL